MNHRFLLLCALAFGSTFLGAEEPLRKSNAYSLELDSEMKESNDFFPIGVLGDREFKILPFLGLNLTEMIHTCYEYPAGKACNYKKNGNGRGKFYFCHWAAHTLFITRKTKTHGVLKNLVQADGKEARHHSICIAEPKTRQYVLDAAASSTKNVLKHDSDSIFLWGIDNEYELVMDYSPETVGKFRTWLKAVYQNDLVRFQQAWGTDCAGFEFANPPPAAERNSRPGPWLDWRRYQEESFADFLHDYFNAVQSQDPLKRPVVAKNTQCTLEMQAVVKNRSVNHELIAEKTRELSQGWYGFDQYGHGDRSNYEMNYFYHCIRPMNARTGKRYGGFSAENNNHAGPGWQFAQTYFRMLANGLRGIDFFVMGSFGAKDDYSTFAFTYPDGIRRDRFYYLSRLAGMIHRTERLWSCGAPAEGLPKIAMLLPQRDILLANETGVSWWDYSTNNRLNVFSRLRDAGYWTDILPYGKLNAAYLKRYKALFLVNAEHLTESECRNIVEYVRDGGILFADMRAGYFDEHHIERSGLADVLGVRFKGVYTGIEVSPDDLWYHTKFGNVIRGDGKILADRTGSKLLNEEDCFRNAKGAWITENQFGRGKAFWFNTRLGALRPESVDIRVLTDWFSDRLKYAGIKPSYDFVHSSSGIVDGLRVEQPMVDPDGNCTFVVAGTRENRIPSGTLTLPLPKKASAADSAWWGDAESVWLEKVHFQRTEKGSVVIELPEVRSAGVLYFLSGHGPMLGMKVLDAKHHAAEDRYTPEFRPGENFSVRVRLVNPGETRLGGGLLRLRALGDWKVSEPESTWSIGGGGSRDYTFRVSIPKESSFFKPNMVYPLVAEFEQKGRRMAVAHAVVSIKLDEKKYDFLLTDNPHSAARPHDFALWTGADYVYEMPENLLRDPLQAKKEGKSGNALNNGLEWGTRTALFRGPNACVVFDLKKEYDIRRVALKYQRSAPTGISLEISLDGKNYKLAGNSRSLSWNGKWTELEISPCKGRFVRIRIAFPNSKGGILDEVEIWGRPF